MGFLRGNDAPMDLGNAGQAALPSMAGPIDSGPIPNNILANIAQTALPSMAGPIPQPKARRSVLDVIGGIADGIATAGGAQAQYQPNIDARMQRAQSMEDREVQQQLQQQQIAQNNQKFEMGNMELDAAQTGRVGQAARGLQEIFTRKGAAGVMKAWPLMVQQLKIPEEQAAAFGAALAEDPENAIAMVSAALSAPSNASKAKELQLYEIAKQENPDLRFTDFLTQMQTDPMSPYQAEQIDINRGRLGIARDNAAWARDPRNPRNQPKANKKDDGPPQAERIEDARNVIAQLKTELGALKESGGINASGQTAAQRVGAFAKENLPLVERITSPEGFSARQRLDGLLTQGVFTLIPMLTGATLGGKSFDAKAEMDNLKRVIGNASDYDAAIRAIEAFEDKIERLEFNDQARSAPRRSGNRPAPRNRRTAPVASGWKILGVE